MRKVKNKKIIRRIADKSLKSRKSRNLIAVLAIALTSVLFTTLFVVGGSIIEKQQEATMRQVGGTAHAGYKYLTPEEYEIVKQDKKLKSVEDFSYDEKGRKKSSLRREYSADGNLEDIYKFTFGKNGTYISQWVDASGNPMGDLVYYNDKEYITKEEYDKLQE